LYLKEVTTKNNEKVLVQINLMPEGEIRLALFPNQLAYSKQTAMIQRRITKVAMFQGKPLVAEDPDYLIYLVKLICQDYEDVMYNINKSYYTRAQQIAKLKEWDGKL
jgi:hypothetical protein